MKRTARFGILALFLFGAVACGQPSAKAGAGGSSRPSVPHDKIEIVDGWIQLKQARTGPDKSLGVMGPGDTQFLIMGNPTSFMVDNADFRAPEGADYGWYGCGPLACDMTGIVVGVCCGGWTAPNAPNGGSR